MKGYNMTFSGKIILLTQSIRVGQSKSTTNPFGLSRKRHNNRMELGCVYVGI